MSDPAASGDFSASNLKDRNWKGEGVTFNPRLAQKPTEKSRRCTDCLCCILFVAFLGAMFAATIYGYMKGNPGELIAPIDGDGNVCGYTPGYENYPNLFIADITQAVDDPSDTFKWGVCASDCPESATDTFTCLPTTNVPVCNPDAANMYGSDEIFNYCWPIYDTLPESAKANWNELKTTLRGNDLSSGFMDIYEARWMFLLTPLICIVFTYGYIFFMDKCAFYLAWFSIFLIQVGLIGVGLGCFFYRQNLVSDMTDEQVDDSSTAYMLEWIIWVSWILAAIYYLLIACSFKALRVAIAVIETAADYYADTKRVTFVPILFFFLGVVILFGWTIAMLCVGSIGELQVDNVLTQSKDVKWADETYYLAAFMWFGIIWIISFLVACNEFVIIVSAVTWYFSDKTIEDDDGIPGDSDVRYGFWWAFRYHFGSLAFGSLLLAFVWIIRAIFEYLGEKLHQATGENGCTKCMMCCCRCCLDCFDRFVRYINRNAYIYMAISSESFCTSALHAFILILKNHLKFAFVDGISDVFMFLAKVLICMFTTTTMYFMITWITEVQSPIAPCIIIFVFSYMIAAVFIAIFDVGANTILQCYLLDMDIATTSGKLEPDHIPPTMDKFFKKGHVQDMMAANQAKYSNVPANDDRDRSTTRNNIV